MLRVMSRRAQVAIKQVIEKLKSYGPERVILFGSYAWGTPDAGSDLDLFIVKKSKKRRLDRMYDVDKLLYPRPMAIDALVYTPQEVARRLKMGDTFIKLIMEEGKVIYERPSHRARG